MAAQLAGIPCPRGRRVPGSSKDRAPGRSPARARKALPREIEPVRMPVRPQAPWARIQQTELVRMPARARVTEAPKQQSGLVRAPVRARATRARTVTAAAPQTVLVTGRFPVATHQRTIPPSEGHRAKPAPKPAVRGALPAWVLPVVVEAHVRGAVNARGDQAMKKEDI
jgi:hypothetical protein